MITDENTYETMRNWEMYTAEGNLAVDFMIEDLTWDMRHGNVTRNELPDAINKACRYVEQRGFREVYDTEPQSNIAHELSLVCDELGWNPIGRWDW